MDNIKRSVTNLIKNKSPQSYRVSDDGKIIDSSSFKTDPNILCIERTNLLDLTDMNKINERRKCMKEQLVVVTLLEGQHQGRRYCLPEEAACRTPLLGQMCIEKIKFN
uniref:Uncharacterized protein n=1 Tax=Romanomermis culicivorax TaxID=13658 RepID=A0A915IY89_ROMCU